MVGQLLNYFPNRPIHTLTHWSSICFALIHQMWENHMNLRFIKLDVVKLNFPERGWNEGQDVIMDSEPTLFLSAAHLLLDQILVRHKNDHLFSSLLTPGSLSISSSRFGRYVRCNFGVIMLKLHWVTAFSSSESSFIVTIPLLSYIQGNFRPLGLALSWSIKCTFNMYN